MWNILIFKCWQLIHSLKNTPHTKQNMRIELELANELPLHDLWHKWFLWKVGIIISNRGGIWGSEESPCKQWVLYASKVLFIMPSPLSWTSVSNLGCWHIPFVPTYLPIQCFLTNWIYLISSRSFWQFPRKFPNWQEKTWSWISSRKISLNSKAQGNCSINCQIQSRNWVKTGDTSLESPCRWPHLRDANKGKKDSG